MKTFSIAIVGTCIKVLLIVTCISNKTVIDNHWKTLKKSFYFYIKTASQGLEKTVFIMYMIVEYWAAAMYWIAVANQNNCLTTSKQFKTVGTRQKQLSSNRYYQNYAHFGILVPRGLACMAGHRISAQEDQAHFKEGQPKRMLLFPLFFHPRDKHKNPD